MRTQFTGVGTALITPFRRDGSVDEPAVKRLVRRQIDAGIHFVSPCGTTGEAPTLSHDEKLRVIELVVDEANGQVPVLAGAGGYDTREVIAFAREVERTGANGLLSVTPYYNKPTPEGLYQHFKAIADSTPLPIILYTVPSRTAINLDVKTTARLAQVRNIVGIKAPGDLVQVSEIISSTPEDFIDGGDRIVLPVHVQARARNGKTMDVHNVWIYEFSEGKLVKARVYADTAVLRDTVAGITPG